MELTNRLKAGCAEIAYKKLKKGIFTFDFGIR